MNVNIALFLAATILVAVLAAFAVFWVASFVYLYSIPDTTVQLDPRLPPQFDQKVRNLMYFNVFGFFWTVAMISAVFQMSVAGAISTWYFSRDASGPQTSTVFIVDCCSLNSKVLCRLHSRPWDGHSPNHLDHWLWDLCCWLLCSSSTSC
jgi:hypothetical protein